MLNLFIYKDNIDDIPIKLIGGYINDKLLSTFNNFLYFSSEYLLVHNDSHFKNHIPIMLVTHNEEGKIWGMCELLWDKEKSIIEIYNVCIHPNERKKNHCKNLILHILNEIQPIMNCDLWIAVSYTNPMYEIVVNIYKNLGFTDLIQTNMYTPSNILYKFGFLELYKFKK